MSVGRAPRKNPAHRIADPADGMVHGRPESRCATNLSTGARLEVAGATEAIVLSVPVSGTLDRHPMSADRRDPRRCASSTIDGAALRDAAAGDHRSAINGRAALPAVLGGTAKVSASGTPDDGCRPHRRARDVRTPLAPGLVRVCPTPWSAALAGCVRCASARSVTDTGGPVGEGLLTSCTWTTRAPAHRDRRQSRAQSTVTATAVPRRPTPRSAASSPVSVDGAPTPTARCPWRRSRSASRSADARGAAELTDPARVGGAVSNGAATR